MEMACSPFRRPRHRGNEEGFVKTDAPSIRNPSHQETYLIALLRAVLVSRAAEANTKNSDTPRSCPDGAVARRACYGAVSGLGRYRSDTLL